MPAAEWEAWRKVPGVQGSGFGLALGPMYHCGCVRRAQATARDATQMTEAIKLLGRACEALEQINATLERHLEAAEKLLRPPGVPHSRRGEKRKR